jgi:hypothetical protein
MTAETTNFFHCPVCNGGLFWGGHEDIVCRKCACRFTADVFGFQQPLPYARVAVSDDMEDAGRKAACPDIHCTCDVGKIFRAMVRAKDGLQADGTTTVLCAPRKTEE